jgi:tetratricopeptide (TPR) repeat protein
MPSRLRLALAAVLALAAGAARAADPWDGPAFSADPKALLAAASLLAPPRGQAVDLLVDESSFRYDARGAVTLTQRRVWRALAPDAARAWMRVERSWAPWHQARPEIRARVVTPDGEVHELDAATLSEQGVRDEDGLLYSDRKVLAGPLPAVRTGAVVELVTVTRDEAPAFDAGASSQAALAQPVPVRLLRLTVEAPTSLPVKLVVRGLALAPKDRTEDGVRRLVLERRDVPAVESIEPGAPRDTAFPPHAVFGWGRSWKDVAERYGAAWEKQLAGADLAAQARAALGEGKPDRAEAVRRIAAWVHRNVRYTGLELGQAAIVPASPGEVLKRRYGDCKDLSLLVTGLLRAAGYDARLVLVRSSWDELAPELPGVSQFDHVIVRVDGAPPLWLDATDPYGAPGRLPSQIEGRLALVTGPGQKDLVRTPETPPSGNRARFAREIRLSEMGRAVVVETRELTGAPAAQERAFRAQIPADRLEEFDQGYARAVFGADELVASSAEGLDDAAAPVKMRYEVREAAAGVTDSDEAWATVAPDQAFDPIPRPVLFAEAEHGTDAPRRKADLVLPYAYQWEIVYRVVPPDGYRPRPAPANATERFGPAVLTTTWRTEANGTIEATYRLDTGGRRLAAADAQALLERARAVLKDSGPRVAFERVGAALLAAGKVPDALAEMRRLAALHPAEAVHPIQLSLALLELGYVDAAAAEARRAIALEPERAWGHRVLGWALEHDGVGRVHGPGWDRAGCLAAYRRAKELDPSHSGGRAMLASVLATAPDGTRYGKGAELDAAIAEYAAIPRGDDPEYALGHADTLFAAGRAAEAEKLARELPRGPQRDAVLLAAIAAQRGAAAAEDEARGLGDGRREALREGAKLLVRGRRYEHAHALVEAAARGAPNAAEIRQQAEAFDGLRRWEELRGQGTDAERLVRALFSTALTAADPTKALAGLVSTKELSPDGVKVATSGMEATVAAARHSVRQQGIEADVVLDLALSKLDISEDGDPRTGLRIRVRAPFAADDDADVIFAVREGKELRIVASGGAWPLLGDLALRRAASGDLATARRLLDWAREVVPGSENDPASPKGIFTRLWRPGPSPARPEVELAAASLSAWAEKAGPATKLLEGARARSTDAADRRAMAFALAPAYRAVKRHEDSLALGRELLAEDPGSRDAFALAAFALKDLKRRQELDALADAMLARLPDDGEVLSLHGSLLLELGDLEAAARVYRRAIDAGRAPAGLYNNAAWLELFRTPGKDALEWARRAAGAERGRDHATQNTLAAVYAAVGRPAEAREVFLKSLEAAGREALGPSDWFVFGRIAEAWGILDAARAAYARVEPEPNDPTSAHLLTQRRLAAMPPTPAAPAKVPAAAPGAPKPGAEPGPGAEPKKGDEKKKGDKQKNRTPPQESTAPA